MILKKKKWSIGCAFAVCMAAFAHGAFAGIVNINAADAQTLAAQISGVGPRLAAAIVEHREQFGPYRSIEDLARVKGIGTQLIERNREFLKLQPIDSPLQDKTPSNGAKDLDGGQGASSTDS